MGRCVITRNKNLNVSWAQLAQMNAVETFSKSSGSCLQGVAEELLTTVANDKEGLALREVLRTVRVITDHLRDRDGRLTTLDFGSSLIILCINVSESDSPDPQQ